MEAKKSAAGRGRVEMGDLGVSGVDRQYNPKCGLDVGGAFGGGWAWGREIPAARGLKGFKRGVRTGVEGPSKGRRTGRKVGS